MTVARAPRAARAFARSNTPGALFLALCMVTSITATAIGSGRALNPTQPSRDSGTAPARPTAPRHHVTVIDAQLKVTVGMLRNFHAGVAELETADGPVRVEKAVALIAAGGDGQPGWGPQRDWPGISTTVGRGSSAAPIDPDAPEVEFRCTDGSLVRGRSLAAKGDVLSLIHPLLGRVDAPLDSLMQINSLRRSSGSPATMWVNDEPRAASGDVVTLANGDRLEGLIESIAPASGSETGLSVRLIRGKEPLTLPMDRITAVQLQNPPTRAAPPWSVWLRSGERTGASECGIDGDHARVLRTSGAIAARLELSEIAGVLRGGSVTPLASRLPRARAGMIERGAPAVLGADDLTITEPGSAAWQLPSGTARVSAWLVLPEECRELGDVTVRISIRDAEGRAGAEVFSCELGGASPVAFMSSEVPAGLAAQPWLLVEVGEGKNGPVQDRVVIRRALVASSISEP